MINAVSSSNPAAIAPSQLPAARPPAPSTNPQDTVHISKQGLAAGDIDHDGDSH
jgi:hypothetical protein